MAEWLKAPKSHLRSMKWLMGIAGSNPTPSSFPAASRWDAALRCGAMRMNLNQKSHRALMPHKEACWRRHSIAPMPASFINMAQDGSVSVSGTAQQERFRFLHMQAAATARIAASQLPGAP